VGIPRVTTFWEVDTNSVISPLTASVLALGLHEAAYLCEIIRSGMISVDRGQIEAAQSLGIRASRVRWQIVLPQALRVMVPPGATRVVALMKDTALVMVISGGELMTTAQEIYGRNYLVLELLMVVTIWYLVIVSVLMLLQRFAERWASRYVSGPQRPRVGLTEG
ncbi:MAG: amino acid ABC transporter permease, partial [Nocardioides sp.]